MHGTLQRHFQVALIKPTHYDDDGYVVQWAYSVVPSNSLAVLNSLVADAAERQVLGTDVAFDITAVDEINTRVQIDSIITRMKKHNNFGMVGLVGVQSNQYPRALDLARPLRAAGIPVVIGGFHVSGCLAMLPGIQPDLQAALDMGVSLFAGEAEGRLDDVLRDVAAGTLKPIYNYLDELPELDGLPTPTLPHHAIQKIAKFRLFLPASTPFLASFDAGRGCPFQCSFCTIINVQGRESRFRTLDDIERVVRDHAARGIRWMFITDDNFARNENWEAIFDRLIQLRERDNIKMLFIIQVDTLCHRIPNFVEKAARAGVIHVFIGLENINPKNLLAAKKRQNKITEYRAMLLAWKKVNVVTTAGYILGFPGDTPQSIREDIEIIKNELPLDILEFFCLTPLPGSEDHKVLWQRGAWMDPDLNKYDLEHVVTDHAMMSKKAWENVYRMAWDQFYTREHMVTIIRRAATTGIDPEFLTIFFSEMSYAIRVHNVHPLQSGFLRRKYRLDRRPDLPHEPIWLFYPKYLWLLARSAFLYWRHMRWLTRKIRQTWEDPNRIGYIDRALTPVADGDTDSLDLLTHSAEARSATLQARKIATLTGHASRETSTAYEARLIRESGLFDEDYYRACRPDVGAHKFGPLWHYLLHGAAEGAWPSPLFDTHYYAAQSPDLGRENPLAHYIGIGTALGRKPHPLFDTEFYLSRYGASIPQGMHPLAHFLAVGGLAGFDPHPLFDSAWYLSRQPQLRERRQNPLVHYLAEGWRQGIAPHPKFDGDLYLQWNPDVMAAGLNPLDHFARHGQSEGRTQPVPQARLRVTP